MPEQRYHARTKSFTRRSRVLPENLQRTFDRDGSRYVIEVPRDGGLTTVASSYHFDAPRSFGNNNPLVVEVGSGAGDQIVAAAAADPSRNFLALEVWKPGIAKIVSRAAEAEISNLRIIEADAAQALPTILSAQTVSEVWTFFPDPWRKARHRKRRLVNDSFAATVSRILQPGGQWLLATDWDDYAWQMRDTIEASPYFDNPHLGERPDPHDPEPSRGGFAPRFEGRVVTRFEQRGLDAGRRVHDILAVRNATPLPGEQNSGATA